MSNETRDYAGTEKPTIRKFGRYWLLRLIARGGMGEVFLAATTGIEGAERPCVIKFIRRDHSKDSSFLARFLDEARVLSQLHHPGVVQVFEAAEGEDGMPFVAAEYVEGRSLAEVRARAIRTSYRLTWSDAVAIGLAAAEALAYVHHRKDERGEPLGIVHRDLSPENIMVGYAGDIKLIDFGTALGENRKSHTIAGVVYAKPGYIAPEVANGHTGDARVDLYALGVMVWELVAGRRFLQGPPAEHLSAVARNERDLPRMAGQVGAPEALDQVLAKLTAHSLDDRYRSAREAVRDLARVLSMAPSLSNGERGVRARISQLMSNLYPSEPASSRREFAYLLETARAKAGDLLDSTIEMSHQSPTPAPTSDTLPGTQYELVRLLGRGGAGRVYEAEHVGLGRKVALKVLAPEHASSPEYISRFRREARALSRLSHPNLVTLHDFGQATDGRLFYAMELLEGESLQQKLARDARLPWRRALEITRQVAQALACTHEVGLVHRDLKPSNLFLTSSGHVKLLDFGVVRSVDDAPIDGTRLEKMTLFGTPEYMAPEQRVSGEVDSRADLYALGTILYEMCTGTIPFEGLSTVALLDAKVRSTPEGVRARCPECEIPRGVENLIMRSLRKDPSERFNDAQQMISAIEEVLERPSRVTRTSRRSRGYIVAAAVSAVVALVTIGAVRSKPRHLAELGRLAGDWMPTMSSSQPTGEYRPTSFTGTQSGRAAAVAARLIEQGKLHEAEMVLHRANMQDTECASSLASTP